MKSRLVLCLLAFCSLLGAEELRVMTFNVRYAGASEDRGVNAWEARKKVTAETIRRNEPVVFGLQEAVTVQKEYFDEQFPEYGSLGVGRADGKEAGEYSPIYYLKSRLRLVDSGYFWLSDTPDVAGSKTWDNQIERICTWARFQLIENEDRFIYVYNTHWDHVGQESRVKSADLILKKMSERPGDNDTVIVMGDFNATEKNPAIELLSERGGLVNAYLSEHADDDRRNTYHPWTGETAGKNTIDHIFVSPDVTIRKVWIDHYQDGDIWPSDHFPIVADLVFEE